jgi:hypothetical protein
VPGRQRIFVVSTTATQAELERVRDDLGRDPVVLAAPSPEAARVMRDLGVEPRVEILLAPTAFPRADRGHQLDALVRRHALEDRFRDVAVVSDPATSTLLLRELAPAQLPDGGAVTVVGLPRGDRPIVVRRAAVAGAAIGLAASVVDPPVPFPVIPAAVALVGLGLLAVAPWRHVGRELLLAAMISVAVAFVVVAGSARFPGAW